VEGVGVRLEAQVRAGHDWDRQLVAGLEETESPCMMKKE